MAAAGISPTVLYSLLRNIEQPGLWIQLPAAFCAVAIALAGASATWALRPRLWSREEPTSNLYFHHIARRHRKPTKGRSYTTAVRALTSTDAELVGEIAGQIWANAHVASKKYRWTNIALSAVFVALITLGMTALAAASTNW